MNTLSRTVLLAGITLATLPPEHCRSDWPAFRGPNRNGIVEKTTLPTEWSPSQNIRWRTELPGQGWSSPIVIGDRIYLTAAIPVDGTTSLEQADEETTDRPGYRLVLFQLDTHSGKLLAETELFQQSANAPRIHSKNSHASPTPVCDGRNLFVHFGHQGTACVTLKGEIVWKNESLGYSPVHGNGGSPAITDDLLIFSRDGAEIAEVTALDKSTGNVVWSVPRAVETKRRFSFCTPLIAEIGGREQIILPGSNVVQSLDPRDGRELWRVRFDGYSVIPRPILESGLVFVCTGYDRPTLLAIDPTGSGDVTETHVKWQTNSSVPHTPSLIGYGGRLLMVNDKGGIVTCLDAATGEELWKKRLGGNFSASPMLADSLLYLLSEEGVCTVLDVAQEPTEISENKLGERCLSTFAVIGNDLLLRTESALYRISDLNRGPSTPFSQ